MVYAYIRTSTDKQSNENQRFEIDNFAQNNNLTIGKYVEETVSGTTQVGTRELGKLLNRMKKGDLLICSELSRLGRSLLMIMSVLHSCMEKELAIWTIKDNYRLGNDIANKVLAFAFSLSAEIERDLISRRTKEALARKKAEGVVLGRRKGSKNKVLKLTEKHEQIQCMIDQKIPIQTMAKETNVHRETLSRYLCDNFGHSRKKRRQEPLKGKEDMLHELLGTNYSMYKISKHLNVTPASLNYYMKRNGLIHKGYQKKAESI